MLELCRIRAIVQRQVGLSRYEMLENANYIVLIDSDC